MDEIERTITRTKSSVFQTKLLIMKVLNYKDHMHEKGDFQSLFDLCTQRKVTV